MDVEEDGRKAIPLSGGVTGGVTGEGKSGSYPMMTERSSMRARYPRNVEVTSAGQAARIVAEAVEVVRPYPEVIEVRDRAEDGLRSLLPADAVEAGLPCLVTAAMEAKLRCIRAQVRYELQMRQVLARIPDLLLVADGVSVTSIWDDAVRQVVEDYGDQSWAQSGPAAEQVLAGIPGSERRWAFMGALDVGAEGDPYLDRLRIVQTPWLGVYLHHIHRPDRDRDPHDHPWSFASLVLAGSYTEMVWRDKLCPSSFRTRERRRWSVARTRRLAAHIITGIEGPLWTLVITGPRRGEWGFWRLGEFIPWREYTGSEAAR